MQNSQSTQTLTVVSSQAGERIDKILFETDGYPSRGFVSGEIKSGKVLVNEQTVKPSYMVKTDDVITYTIPEVSKGLATNAEMTIDIIDENENFLIVNKPRGLQVHPGASNETDTLANALIAHDENIKDVGDDPLRPGIMHRLDKDTSGLMVIAKNNETFEALKKQFADRNVEKRYFCLAWGHFEEKEGVIDAPIARAASYTKQKIVDETTRGSYKGEAKEAVTEFAVKEECNWGDEKISLVELTPRTGRMHQIRIHLSHRGHSPVGDKKYATKKEKELNKKFREAFSETNETFLLHAAELGFVLRGKKYSYDADLPDYFHNLLKKLL